MLAPAVVAALGVVSASLLIAKTRIDASQVAAFEEADALAQLRNRLATSHLWLEEAAAGGDPAKAGDDLGDLVQLGDLVARGGRSPSGRELPPPLDASFRGEAETLLSLISQWRVVVAQSLENLADAREGSEVERRGDEVFEALQGKAAIMEHELRARYAELVRREDGINVALVLFWCCLVATATTLLWLRERRRVAVERRLAQANAELERRVANRTRVLQELNGQLLTAQETERRRVATELHDALGHTLVLAKIGLSGVRAEVARPSTAAAGLAELETTLDLAIDETHRLAHDLRPAMLENVGLSAALRALAGNGITHRGVRVESRIDDVDLAIPEAAHVVVYRIIQEALTNVTKHAHATRVSIVVRRRPGVLEASVEDDGPGFELATTRHPGAHGGWGLATMKERARLLGGVLVVASAVGHGTRVQLEVPTSQVDPS